MCHGVGTLIAIISQLNTLPACAPVNASMAASRLATHDSGSGWFATPFLYDSFIHDSTPVLSRRTTQAVRRMQDEGKKVNPEGQLVKFAYPEPPDGKAFPIAQIAGNEVACSG
jgi:hypothetical protein